MTLTDNEKVNEAWEVVRDKIEHGLPPYEELTKEEYEHICLTLKQIKKILDFQD